MPGYLPVCGRRLIETDGPHGKTIGTEYGLDDVTQFTRSSQRADAAEPEQIADAAPPGRRSQIGGQ